MNFNEFINIKRGCIIVLNDNILLKFIDIINDELIFTFYKLAINKASNCIINTLNKFNDNSNDKIIINKNNEIFFNSIKLYDGYVLIF